jgi:hypothetical protein
MPPGGTPAGRKRRMPEPDVCVAASSLPLEDIALIDNDSGHQVLNMSGRGCESVIVRKWMEALEGVC